MKVTPEQMKVVQEQIRNQTKTYVVEQFMSYDPEFHDMPGAYHPTLAVMTDQVRATTARRALRKLSDLTLGIKPDTRAVVVTSPEGTRRVYQVLREPTFIGGTELK